jgi:hypothetical protein
MHEREQNHKNPPPILLAGPGTVSTDAMKIFRMQQSFIEESLIKNSKLMSLSQLQAIRVCYLRIYDQECSSPSHFEHVFPFLELSALSLDPSIIV